MFVDLGRMRIDFGKPKVKLFGSPSLAKTVPVQSVPIVAAGAEEVLKQKTERIDHRNWLADGRGQRPMDSGVAGTPIDVRDRTSENRELEFCQLRLKGTLDSLDLRDVDRYAFLLRRCGSARDLLEGKRVHAHIVRGGYDRDRFLGNLLVQMYGKCGNVDDAQAVFDKISQPNVFSWNMILVAYAQNGHMEDARVIFDKMPRRDSVSWNAIMAAYVQNGHGKAALKVFRQMNLAGVKPVTITFVSCLDACAGLTSLQEGKAIHASVVNSEYESDIVVETALVNMYGKCGNLNNARCVFDKMSRRDVVSWTVMIAAYSRNGYGEVALELFQQMHLEGVKPDKVTFISILDACASLAYLEGGKAIHANILDGGFSSESVVGTALVNMYGKCGSVENARSVFDNMPQRNGVSWNAMIAAYAQNGHGKGALELFQQMDLEGMEPDKITFISILSACASQTRLKVGRMIHAGILNACFESDVGVGTALVNMYGKCGSLEDAKSVFDKLPERDVVSWNAMMAAYVWNGHFSVARRLFDTMLKRDVASWNVVIAAYAQDGHSKKALELFWQMNLEDVKPNKITFIGILDACTSLPALEVGKIIHASILEGGFGSDVVTLTALVNMYGKCGRLGDAWSVFEKIPQRDVISWNAMITSHAQIGHGRGAVELFQLMEQERVKPDKVTFISILTACASLAAIKEGKIIHASIVAWGLDSDTVVGNALVNMYGNCGSLDDARSVFDKMPPWNLVSWNAMIEAYAQNGHAMEALQLYQQMDLEGVKPDKITFISILSACSHTGLLDDGWHFFMSMNRVHGITPLAEHYGCMIDLLGRGGQLAKAEDLIGNMPFEPCAVAWMNLLGACRIHGDVERGACTAQHVFELDPKNAAPYVLLSNIYAAAGRWNDVAKVRKMMKDMGMKQQYGHSCIEF